LDSTSSKEVCDALRTVARLGLTVITVIHQPRYEIFTMFDDVLLLGKGGKTVYLGPTKTALPYFQDIGFECPLHSNPADFFLDVISGTMDRKDHPEFKTEDLFELWEQKKLDKRWNRDAHSRETDSGRLELIENDASTTNQPEAQVEERTMASFTRQLWLFFFRAIIQQTRDIASILIDFCLVCLAGSLLGIVFFNAHYVGPPEKSICQEISVTQLQDRCELPIDDPVATIASLICLCLALTGVASALRVFGNERVVFWRESSGGVSTLAYFLAKDFAQIANMVICPLIFLTFYYSLTAPRSPFITMFAIVLLIQFTSTGIGYLVSIVVAPTVAQLTAVVVVLICVMFSGARPTLPQMKTMPFPMPYVPYISYMRWAEEAIYITEIGRFQDVYDVTTGLNLFGYSLENFTEDMTMILALGLAFRIIAYVLLEILNRDKRK